MVVSCLRLKCLYRETKGHRRKSQSFSYTVGRMNWAVCHSTKQILFYLFVLIVGTTKLSAQTKIKDKKIFKHESIKKDSSYYALRSETILPKKTDTIYLLQRETIVIQQDRPFLKKLSDGFWEELCILALEGIILLLMHAIIKRVKARKTVVFRKLTNRWIKS